MFARMLGDRVDLILDGGAERTRHRIDYRYARSATDTLTSRCHSRRSHRSADRTARARALRYGGAACARRLPQHYAPRTPIRVVDDLAEVPFAERARRRASGVSRSWRRDIARCGCSARAAICAKPPRISLNICTNSIAVVSRASTRSACPARDRHCDHGSTRTCRTLLIAARARLPRSCFSSSSGATIGSLSSSPCSTHRRLRLLHRERWAAASCLRRRSCASQAVSSAISGGVLLDRPLSNRRFHRLEYVGSRHGRSGTGRDPRLYDAALGESLGVAVARRADWRLASSGNCHRSCRRYVHVRPVARCRTR